MCGCLMPHEQVPGWVLLMTRMPVMMVMALRPGHAIADRLELVPGLAAVAQQADLDVHRRLWRRRLSREHHCHYGLCRSGVMLAPGLAPWVPEC